MKKVLQRFLLLAALAIPWVSSAQVQVTVGTGTSTSYYAPFNNYYKNSTNECLYLSSEINQAGQIDTIWYNCSAGATLSFTTLNVYMATTSATTLASGWEAMSDLQQVYTGTNVAMPTASGWYPIVLSTPFYYDGTDNLVIVVTKTCSSYSSSLKFYYTATTGGCRYRQSDSDASYASLTSSVAGSSSTYRANVRLSMNTSVGAPCTRPATLTATNVTATSATINFTAGGSETAWVGEISPAVNGVSTMALSNTNPINLTGLMDNTTYTVGVRSICGVGDTSAARTVSFTTPCLPVATSNLPYVENFEDYGTGSTAAMSACMHKGTNSSTAYPYPTGSYLHDNSTRCLYMYGSSTYYSYMALPHIDTNISSLIMTFKAYKTSAAYTYVQVGTMSDPSDYTTFTPYDTIQPNGLNTWEDFEILFNNYTGTDQYIAFMCTASSTGSYNYAYIDDIEVDLLPSCFTVTDFAANNALSTTNSVTLSWNDRNSAGSFWVGYAPYGSDNWTYAVATGSPYTVTGLEASSPYQFSVSPICAAGDTAYAKYCNGRTACPATLTAPYYENFSAYADAVSSYYYASVTDGEYPLPSCWQFPNLHATGGSTAANAPQAFISSYSSYALDGNRLIMRGYGTTAPCVAALPLFTNDVNSLQIDFDYRQYSSTYGTLQIGVMTDPTDTTTFVLLESLPRTTTYAHVNHDFGLDVLPTASTLYIALRHLQESTSSAYNVSHIDNIAVTVAPTCKYPRNFAITTSNDTVNLSWTAVGSSTNFQMAYGTVGTAVEDMTTTNLTGNSASVVLTTGLYDFYLRTDCGTEQSEWVGPLNAAIGAINMDSTMVLTGCNFVLADHGGINGQYANNREDTVYIYAPDACSTIRLQGSYNTESISYDYLEIYTSIDSGATWAAKYGGTGNIDFTSPTGMMMVRFRTDASGVYDGFVLQASCTPRAISTPVNEGFENGMPACWNIVYGDGAGTTNPVTLSTDAHTGSQSLRFSSYNNTTDYTQYLISPELNLSDLAELSFSYKKHTSYGSDYLWLGLSTTGNDTADFTWTSMPATSNWADYSAYIEDSIKYVAFRYWGNYAYYVYLDDIAIVDAPTCFPTENLTVTGATDTSISLSWTTFRPISNFMVSYDTISTTVSGNSYTVNGLEPYTEYTFTVTPLCSETESGTPASVTGVTNVGCTTGVPTSTTVGNGTNDTPAMAFYNSSYTNYLMGENYVLYTSDELLAIGMGLENTIQGIKLQGGESGGTIANAKIYVKEVTTNAISSANDTVASSDMTLVFSGNIDITANAMNTIVFNNAFTYNTSNNLMILFRRDTNEVAANGYVSFVGHEISNRGFYHYNSGSYESGYTSYYRPNTTFDFCAIQDGCWFVTDVEATNVSNEEATITWNLMDTNQNNFTVAYGLGTDPATMTTVSSNTNSATLTGLTPGAMYNVFVKAVCDSVNSSTWSPMTSFRTSFCSSDNQCYVSFVLEDSYGDGWNGAYFDVVDNDANITILSYGLTNGDNDTINIALCEGRQYNVVWNSGNYDDEASLTITNLTLGTTLYSESDMSNESEGTILTFTHSCHNVYALTVNTADTVMGSVTGMGTYTEGDTATLTAVANYGYHFTNWNDNNTDNPRYVVVESDSTFTANFDYNQYTINGVAADTTMGTVTGSATVNYLSNVTLTATANTGYHFMSWTDGETNATRTVTALSDSTFTATFAIDTFTVAATANDEAFGTVTGAGEYVYGTEVTLTATANTGYHFMNWSNGETEATLTFTVTENVELTANFAIDTFTVTAAANNAEYGTVTGAGEYVYGAEATLTATANEGYHFVNWSNGETNATLTFTVTENVELTANFEANVGIQTATIDNIKVYPNPTLGKVTISTDQVSKVEVLDLVGRMVAIYEGTNMIDLSNLNNGIYTLRITTNEGVAVQKVVKK